MSKTNTLRHNILYSYFILYSVNIFLKGCRARGKDFSVGETFYCNDAGYYCDEDGIGPHPLEGSEYSIPIDHFKKNTLLGAPWTIRMLLLTLGRDNYVLHSLFKYVRLSEISTWKHKFQRTCAKGCFFEERAHHLGFCWLPKRYGTGKFIRHNGGDLAKLGNSSYACKHRRLYYNHVCEWENTAAGNQFPNISFMYLYKFTWGVYYMPRLILGCEVEGQHKTYVFPPGAMWKKDGKYYLCRKYPFDYRIVEIGCPPNCKYINNTEVNTSQIPSSPIQECNTKM